MDLPSGTVLAERWRILGRLGEGGMGSVYQVEDVRRPGSAYALKVLIDDRTMPPEERAWALKRFEDEIALLATLKHPRIPAYIASFTEGGLRCFVMELVRGETLEERQDRTRAPLPELDVLRWMSDVCDVLGYLHGQRPPIIVRDLKPGNIMITTTGEVRLIDFGIARTYKPGKMGNTENLGTAIYASPEHHGQGQTDARSDIYSLGATMYHLLTYTEPVPLETPAPGAIRRYAPTVSEATERIVIRAMELNPADRYQTALQVRDDIRRRIAAFAPPAPAPVTAPQPAAAPAAPVARPSSSATAQPVPAARVVRPVAAPAAPPAPARRPAPAPAARPQGQGIACPACGYVNRPGARFCTHDGTPLSAAAARLPLPPQTAPVTRVVPAVSTGLTTADLQARRATELFSAGKYAQAVRQAEQALHEGRTTDDLLLLLGRAQRQLGRPREAAEAFARAAQLHPTAEALCLEGEAWREAGDTTRAQVALTRARQQDPRDPEISRQLGLLCLDQGLLAQAEGELLEGLRQAPTSASLLLALGRVYAARQQWPDAVARLSAAAKADPASAEAQRELGRALGASGERKKAAEALKRALALDPHDAEARRLLNSL